MKSKGENGEFLFCNPLVDDLVDITTIVLNSYTTVFNCVGGKDNEGQRNLESLHTINT